MDSILRFLHLPCHELCIDAAIVSSLSFNIEMLGIAAVSIPDDTELLRELALRGAGAIPSVFNTRLRGLHLEVSRSFTPVS